MIDSLLVSAPPEPGTQQAGEPSAGRDNAAAWVAAAPTPSARSPSRHAVLYVSTVPCDEEKIEQLRRIQDL